MDKYEKKYGFREDKKVKDFHRSRRMFAVDDRKLILAEPNLPYSHAKWFEKNLEWDKLKHEKMMAEGLRGIIDTEGNVSFYAGYDFRLNDKIEKEFFEIFPELVKNAKLKPNAQISGGMIKGEPGTRWPPQKVYGHVKDLIKEK